MRAEYTSGLYRVPLGGEEIGRIVSEGRLELDVMVISWLLSMQEV